MTLNCSRGQKRSQKNRAPPIFLKSHGIFEWKIIGSLCQQIYPPKVVWPMVYTWYMIIICHLQMRTTSVFSDFSQFFLRLGYWMRGKCIICTQCSSFNTLYEPSFCYVLLWNTMFLYVILSVLLCVCWYIRDIFSVLLCYNMKYYVILLNTMLL